MDLFRFDVTEVVFLDLRDLVKYGAYLRPSEAFSAALRPDWQLPRILWVPAFKKASIAMAQSIESGAYDVAFVHLCEKMNSPYLLRYLQQVPKVFYCQEPYRALEPHRNIGRGVKEKIVAGPASPL